MSVRQRRSTTIGQGREQGRVCPVFRPALPYLRGCSALPCPPCHVLALSLRLPCPPCPVPALLLCLPCPSYPATTLLLLLLCPSHPVLASCYVCPARSALPTVFTFRNRMHNLNPRYFGRKNLTRPAHFSEPPSAIHKLCAPPITPPLRISLPPPACSSH